ncbi:hypothetical protein EMIT0158MI4_60154 [Burkholderia ambifaria]
MSTALLPPPTASDGERALYQLLANSRHIYRLSTHMRSSVKRDPPWQPPTGTTIRVA